MLTGTSPAKNQRPPGRRLSPPLRRLLRRAPTFPAFCSPQNGADRDRVAFLRGLVMPSRPFFVERATCRELAALPPSILPVVVVPCADLPSSRRRCCRPQRRVYLANHVALLDPPLGRCLSFSTGDERAVGSCKPKLSRAIGPSPGCRCQGVLARTLPASSMFVNLAALHRNGDERPV